MEKRELKILILLIFAAAVILLVPYFIRIWQGNSNLIGSQPYYNLRHIESANDASTLRFDSLQNRTYDVNIINYSLIKSQNLLFTAKLLPFLLGIFSILLLYLILKKHNISERTLFSILFLTVLSPIFIYIFTSFTSIPFVIFLSLFGFYVFISKKSYLSIIVFIITPFINVFASFIMLIFLLCYVIITKQNKKYYMLIPIFLAVMLAFMLNPVNPITIFDESSSAGNLLSDVGANIGFSVSILVLAFIGVMLLWEKKTRVLAVYLVFLAMFILSFFSSSIKIAVSFILAVYAGFALIYLMQRKWSIPLIKKITLLLIICSVLFSTASYISRLYSSEPNKELIDSLTFLKQNSFSNESVLSVKENGFFIEYFGQRNAAIDEFSYRENNYNEKIKDINTIYSSRSLKTTEDLLKKYNIKYILINAELKNVLLKKQGLSFLLEHSNSFIKIYEYNSIEIWMYSG